MTGPLHYGVIGTGMMGVEHIRDIQALDGAEVTALCDPDEGSLSAARGVAGDGPACFNDHRDLLADDRCDAIVVATPNMTHCDILLDVISAGIPVLVEKPLCLEFLLKLLKGLFLASQVYVFSLPHLTG